MGWRVILVSAGSACLVVAAACGGPATGPATGGSGGASGASGVASPSASPCPSFTPRAAPSPGAFQPPVVSGAVTSTGSGTLTVRDRTTGAEVLVTYGASTPIRSGGGPGAGPVGSPAPQDGSPAVIRTGDFVSVQGSRQADSSVAATAMMVRTAGAPGPGRRSGCRPSPIPG